MSSVLYKTWQKSLQVKLFNNTTIDVIGHFNIIIYEFLHYDTSLDNWTTKAS